ncbi:hypothetical protein [Rhizobium grahamii]|uniref:Uncharacterized protein n=1 Tax=Rhizobium grahamii CCGE 502 TaxID=990285 RepID=S3IAU8_9HYPH|nr:hypothetical protein [Rhizobium grahamii]EPE96393.1 hypothetical protein RGCCGE502_21035 [Rhizobium grahamii CCGE 502]
MNREEHSVAVSESSTSASAWGLRYPGFVMSAGGKNEVKEFTGMWPLKPGFDLKQITDTLVPGGLLVPPGASFAPMTTKLGLIRTARWFVGTSGEFGPTLYFISQFDGSLDKYFDDFVLNGVENLAKVWGQCIGCPTPPNATARDVVEYIARGQIKTLACYDVAPSLSIGQIYKAADWYEKTQRFQRAVAKGDGTLEEQVNAFIKELAEPYVEVESAAIIDTEAEREWQYGDVAERLQKYTASE